MALPSALATEIVIPVCALVGIAYSYCLVRWFLEWRNSDELDHEEQGLTRVQARCDQIEQQLSKGVETFMFMEYRYVEVFVVVSAIVVFLCLGFVDDFCTQSPYEIDPSNMCKPALALAIYSAVSFLLGAFTSVLSNFLSMRIAIYASARTALEERKGVGRAFFSAQGTSAAMGFLHAANGPLVLFLAIILFKPYYGNDWEGLFNAIAGYGLGGSSMALFGRAAGGIYAKAADVCNHLVEETRQIRPVEERTPVEKRTLPEVSYIVGGIVGDIAGMGTDHFGSYATSSCAALVLGSISSFGNDHNFTAMCYPLLISSMGILACLMATLFTANFSKIKEVKEIKPTLRKTLIISTILMTFGIVIVSWITPLSSFTVYNFGKPKVVKNWELGLCVGFGLYAGLIIGLVPKYSTTKASSSFLDAAADTINAGLGTFKIPFFAGICFFLSYSFAATYGTAMAALGMLCTMATRLAIDAYSPISHNSKEFARMAGWTALDAVGNTNGQGYAIDSAALVSIVLVIAFLSRVAISPTDVLTLRFFIGVVVGGRLPDKFSAMIMKSVGNVASQMARLVIVRSGLEPVRDDLYAQSSTDRTFRGTIRPFALVILTPFIVGTLFGVETLFGVLAGSFTSVVQIVISTSKNGVAWEKAQEDIKAGVLESPDSEIELEVAGPSRFAQPEQEYDEFVTSGNFIGDPLKDPSGPALNILVQLMAVESLVFAPFFVTYGGLLFEILREGARHFPF